MREPDVAEYLVDNWLVGDERDDPHRGAAPGAEQRILQPDHPDQTGPADASLLDRSALNPVVSVFLEEIALLSDLDALKEEEKVSMMTLHNSKGLEFRAVMIAGLEEGLLPHYSAFDDDSELEEEHRLFYVGMTRAMEELYLFCAASRMQFGSWTGNRPSRFLDEVPEEHTEVTGWGGPSTIRSTGRGRSRTWKVREPT